MIKSVVCTLFEDSYHFGVAALVNSLFRKGFQGDFFAGYKGKLPTWASDAQKNEDLDWPNAQTIQVKEGFALHFLPLTTASHLTNYKPDFMLELCEGPASGATQLFYLDPDIVVNTNWAFFEEWAGFGIAVCEDINSPLPANHPKRKGWRRYFQEYNIHLAFKEPTYANGGFIGVTRNDVGFLRLWRTIQEKMAYHIGGLQNSQFGLVDGMSKELSELNYLFNKTDQDALNAALEAWRGEVSFIGKEAMGFRKGGHCVLPHAVGSVKPWDSSPLLQALQGYPPRTIDRSYFENAVGAVSAHPKMYCILRNFELHLAGFIGRFYKRS